MIDQDHENENSDNCVLCVSKIETENVFFSYDEQMKHLGFFIVFVSVFQNNFFKTIYLKDEFLLQHVQDGLLKLWNNFKRSPMMNAVSFFKKNYLPVFHSACSHKWNQTKVGNFRTVVTCTLLLHLISIKLTVLPIPFLLDFKLSYNSNFHQLQKFYSYSRILGNQIKLFPTVIINKATNY